MIRFCNEIADSSPIHHVRTGPRDVIADDVRSFEEERAGVGRSSAESSDEEEVAGEQKDSLAGETQHPAARHIYRWKMARDPRTAAEWTQAARWAEEEAQTAAAAMP